MSSISVQPVPSRVDGEAGMSGMSLGVQSVEPELEHAVSKFVQFFQSAASLHSTVSEVHRLCAAVEVALRTGIPKERLQTILLPAYRLHGRSRFVSRLQDWPRGYPGDFETIEWIAKPVPQADAHDPAYWLEWYALNCPIAQQHRNKLAWQRHLIHNASLRAGSVLNVGCGGCADLADSPSFIRECDFTLLDMDGDALALATHRLRHAKSVRTVERDVVRGVRDVIGQGPYDLVLCGGLFDYLPDRLISRLLRQFSDALSVGGCIAFTNISDQNPFRVWMENLANWFLLHRSEDQVESIVREAGIDPSRLVIEQDASGLTLLCRIQN